MSLWDGRILEIATQDDDGVVNVGEIGNHDHIHVSKSQVSVRCSKLAEHGLLRNVGHGVYMITEEGRAYLNGEYDADAEAYVQEGSTGPTASETSKNGV